MIRKVLVSSTVKFFISEMLTCQTKSEILDSFIILKEFDIDSWEGLNFLTL